MADGLKFRFKADKYIENPFFLKISIAQARTAADPILIVYDILLS
jgi:hypothetical protein